MEESDYLGIRELIGFVKKDQHPELFQKQKNEVSDDEKELRFFKLRFFITVEWDEGRVEDTVGNIS